MTRKSVLLVLALVVCLPLSCTLLTEVHVDAPPKAGDEADKWWEKTVDRLPLPFLAVYAAASEVHLRKGTAATYIDWYKGYTNGGVYQYELQLPSPPPEQVFTRIRERLKGYKAGEASDRRQDHVVMAEECRGCSLQQALDVWHDADKKINPPKPKKSKE